MSSLSPECTLESVIRPKEVRHGWSWWTSPSDIEDIRDLCSVRPLVAGPMYVSVLTCAGWRFALREPIAVQESYERGTWTRRFDPLGILAYGHSQEEAAEAFCEEFVCCWEEIACEENDNLTVDARELKGVLLSIVKDAKPLE